MTGEIVARGPDAPHVCRPEGDRVRTYKLPTYGLTGSATTSPWKETYARKGDVYRCDCGTAWVAHDETVNGKGVWGLGGYTALGTGWRREGRFARWRRTRSARR